MKNIDKKDNVPNTLRKTIVFFITTLFVISSVMTIENVGSTKDNELEVRLGFVEPGGENWWNSSFYYRKLITINHSQVDEDLANFPILVYRFKDTDLNLHPVFPHLPLPNRQKSSCFEVPPVKDQCLYIGLAIYN